MSATDQYRFNGCQFDASDGRLVGTESGQAVSLRPQAGRLLERFLSTPDEVLDRDTLCKAVWSEGIVVDFESGLAALLRELRQALDQVGAGADLIETVPRRGYRFHGQLETPPSADRSVPGQRKLVLAGMAIGALLLAAGLWIFWGAGATGPDRTAAIPALAILPFEIYLDDHRTADRLSLLLADTVLARLWDAELEHLELIGRAALGPYQDRVDVAVAVSNNLGVELLLEGTVVTEANGQWRVEARLLHMPRGTIVWSSSLDWTDTADLPVNETAARLVENLAADWFSIRSDRFNP